MYITQSLHRMVQRAPDAIATIDGSRTESWSSLRDRVARFAGAMRGLGLRPGDRIAMLSRNGDHYLEYIYGTVWAGGAFNPVNLRWTPPEIAFSLDDCDTRILIVEPAYEALVPAIRAAAPRLEHVLSTGETAAPGIVPRSQWFDAAPQVEDAVRRGDDLAAILYTGGTTGRSKGVMLHHTSLVGSAIGCLACAAPHPGDTFLHSAPLFHAGPLSCLFIMLCHGTASAFIPSFEPAEFMAEVERLRISDTFLVPTMLRMVLDHPRFAEFDLSSLRMIRYGAMAMDAGLMDRALAAFPDARYVQGYGLTETGPVITILSADDHAPEARADGRLGSAGRAMPLAEVMVVGPDDKELPRGEIGEVVCRAPHLMLGYWNRPDETLDAMRGGWFHTGDLGRMDERGYLTIVDRLKDMIITGGENVYSAEVEDVLSTHPSVAQSAVIGLPDEEWGERVHAVIVLRTGVSLDLDSLQAHCRGRLAGYKIPRSLELVDTMPLSGPGKVLKSVLRGQRRQGEPTPLADVVNGT